MKRRFPDRDQEHIELVNNPCSNIAHLPEKPIKAYSLKLAVRAIVGKYILFAKRILSNPDFAKNVARM